MLMLIFVFSDRSLLRLFFMKTFYSNICKNLNDCVQSDGFRDYLMVFPSPIVEKKGLEIRHCASTKNHPHWMLLAI